MKQKIIDTTLQHAEDEAAEVRAKFPGAVTWQKWTCTHCGERMTNEFPNRFASEGFCSACECTTVIAQCGFAMMAPVDDESRAELRAYVLRATSALN
jgi:hypothetical protein